MTIPCALLTEVTPRTYAVDASALGIRPGTPFPEAIAVLGKDGRAYTFSWGIARSVGTGGIESVEYSRGRNTLLVIND